MRSHFKVILKPIVCGSNFSDLRLYSFHASQRIIIRLLLIKYFLN